VPSSHRDETAVTGGLLVFSRFGGCPAAARYVTMVRSGVELRDRLEDV
jgi:hypothetical protein